MTAPPSTCFMRFGKNESSLAVVGDRLDSSGTARFGDRPVCDSTVLAISPGMIGGGAVLRCDSPLRPIRQNVVVGVVVARNLVVYATKRENERERQRSREAVSDTGAQRNTRAATDRHCSR